MYKLVLPLIALMLLSLASCQVKLDDNNVQVSPIIPGSPIIVLNQ